MRLLLASIPKLTPAIGKVSKVLDTSYIGDENHFIDVVLYDKVVKSAANPEGMRALEYIQKPLLLERKMLKEKVETFEDSDIAGESRDE